MLFSDLNSFKMNWAILFKYCRQVERMKINETSIVNKLGFRGLRPNIIRYLSLSRLYSEKSLRSTWRNYVFFGWLVFFLAAGL